MRWRRESRQAEIDSGKLPDFLPETHGIREHDWHVTTIPADLQDRRVEITGPTDRKMIINALNSGAKVFMADCEDSMTPTWDNVVQGQSNLREAVARRIEFTSPEGKNYRLNERTAVLLVNLGTPQAPEAGAVRRFLREFLSDPRVVEIPRLPWWLILHGVILRVRPAKSAAKYASIWTREGSPLKVWTEKQAKLLQGWLAQRGHKTAVIDFDMVTIDLANLSITVKIALDDGNPVARQFRASLLRYMASDAFQPSIALTADQIHNLRNSLRNSP